MVNCAAELSPLFFSTSAETSFVCYLTGTLCGLEEAELYLLMLEWKACI